MADPAVAADLDQPLDVERDVAAKIALDANVMVDIFPELRGIVLGQVSYPDVRIHARFGADLRRRSVPDSENISKSNLRSIPAIRAILVAPPLI